MKAKITVLCPDRVKRGGLLYFYSLYPILRKKYPFVDFKIVHSLDYCLEKDQNESILIVRYLSNNHKFADIDTTEILYQLRDKYKNLSVFDDGARTSLDFPQALPIVDTYFHCQLFSDSENYKRPVKRGQLYSEYYAKMGVKDHDNYKSVLVDEESLSKIHLAWNIGAGCYPRKDLLRKAGLVAANFISPKLLPIFYTHPQNTPYPDNGEKFDVQARFSIQSVTTIAYQRELVLKKVKNDNRVLTGFVSPGKFKEEIKNTKIVLSPFGWGEVCFRDFEAVLNGALLLKPDMDHLSTWPDIYKPNETYVPFQWNCKDLPEKIDQYLQNDEKRRAIANNAYECYMDQLGSMDEKVEDLVNELVNQ
ncbi:MAG: glycosyltransferase [Balneolaceae bacterium]|nr:glycosyltransferase [Balneolaceae bacterium]MDR9409549.1 glycosyltransferase [Balneolaceae bacterium]